MASEWAYKIARNQRRTVETMAANLDAARIEGLEEAAKIAELKRHVNPIGKVIAMTRAYYLRPMPRKLAHKYFCSASVEPGIPCCKLASFYLVARPLRGRPSLYRRCEECARRNAKELRIVFEEVKG